MLSTGPFAPATLARLTVQTRPRARGSIRFPACRLLVTLGPSRRSACFAQRRLGFFTSLGREPGRRSLSRNFPISRLAARDCEGDARHCVGERHGEKLQRFRLDRRLGPRPQSNDVRIAMKQHGMRAHDGQFAQMPIAHPRDAAQPPLAAGGVPLGRQPQGGGQFARAGDAGRNLNARRQRRGGDRAEAGNAHRARAHLRAWQDTL